MFGREPALWLGLAQALIALAVGFGLDWTAEQVSLVMAAVAAVVAFLVRSQTTSNTTVRELIELKDLRR
jgi:hypothetical protein